MACRRRKLKEDVLIPAPGIAAHLSTDLLAVDDPEVAAAVRFVRENSHRCLRVSDVLREVNVSRRWLERRVFDSLGVTLGGYLPQGSKPNPVRVPRTKSQSDVAVSTGRTEIMQGDGTTQGSRGLRCHARRSIADSDHCGTRSAFRARSLGGEVPLHRSPIQWLD